MGSHAVDPTDRATPLQRATANRATLVFVRRYSSGASRRMESLIAWVKVTRKRNLDVLELDADRHSPLVAKLGVKTAPSLVLVKDRRVVGRIEGRASGRQIDDLIRPHLE
jgi:thioredoxin-like negative regulator of GroEL